MGYPVTDVIRDAAGSLGYAAMVLEAGGIVYEGWATHPLTAYRILKDKPDEIVAPFGDLEFLSPGAAMQRKRIALAIYANLAIAGPADNRKQNRGGSIPDRLIQLPDQFNATRPPFMKFGAKQLHLRSVAARAGEKNRFAHRLNLIGSRREALFYSLRRPGRIKLPL